MSTTKKPSQEEDEYFAKEDALRRHNLAVETRQMEAAERERLKQLHFMKCPKCGFDLETIQYKGLAIDKCFHCNGTWLDAGELESLAGKESHVLQSIIAVFKRGK